MNQPPSGLISIPSHHSVDDTISRITTMLSAKGVKLFTVVDHSGEAEAVGLYMPPTKLLIFGNPQAGTPLMLARPTVAIDLPLKLLVAEDEGGNVTITYNSADYLSDRHHLPEDLLGPLAAVAALAIKAAE
jgi:uncharacterized protein (DUF302 family)